MFRFIAACIFLMGCAYPEPPEIIREDARVEGVLDGDTFSVHFGGRLEKVRILGINAPELGKKECSAVEAQLFLQDLLEGKYVVLERNTARKSRDRYRRLLRTVYLNETDVALMLVKDGYARVYVQWEDEHALTYAVYEEEARNLRKGLWNCTDLRNL